MAAAIPREPIVGSASNLPVNTWLKDGAYLPRAEACGSRR
jgi:hypothetical protein